MPTHEEAINSATTFALREKLSLSADPEKTSNLYLNDLCESTYGMGDAGTFSLLSVRAKTIGDSIISAYRQQKVV